MALQSNLTGICSISLSNRRIAKLYSEPRSAWTKLEDCATFAPMDGRGRKYSTKLVHPLLNPLRKHLHHYWWLPVVLVVVFLCGLRFSSHQVVHQRVMSVTQPAMSSVTPPQAQPIERSPAKATQSSEQPSAEDSKETNVYAATTDTQVDKRFAGIPERVYVPNVGDDTVDVIDPKTFRVVDHYAVGQTPHHVTPSWDMKKLYVNNEASSSLMVIDPKTGKPTDTVSVPYPYNLYFTPDGEKAIVVVERLQTLEFRDPDTWRLLGSVYIPSPGVDHMDFSAEGDYLLASSEWGGVVTKVDTKEMKITGSIEVGGNPVDVKLSPDGKVFYVANQGEGYGGVHVIDPRAMKQLKFIPTGAGAHGLCVSRDTKSLYVANRLAGTISVIDFATRKVTATWDVGGSPDMLQLSPDGTQLWYADRYNGTVSVVNARSGKLIHRIAVGYYPHGLSYFPNVGLFSLGHNGVYR
jgi:YVTN family beta-propeller protein